MFAVISLDKDLVNFAQMLWYLDSAICKVLKVLHRVVQMFFLFI